MPTDDTAPRRALVTGGSRGIGRAITERLTRDGVAVVFSYAHREDAAAEVVAAVEARGGTAHALQADLAEPDATEALFHAAEHQLGGLDILVNNAAADVRPALFAQTRDEDYDRMMAVNTRAVFALIRHAATRLRDGGRIINISTLNTVLPNPGVGVYAASKAAVEQFSAVAARELGPRQITVNTVSPGFTDTELLRANNPGLDIDALAAERTPLGRLGRPDDVADVVAFLAGPDARWITGQNLRASGGLP